jgi:hypothetical protein
MKEWREPRRMFMDVRMCEYTVCMKGKSINYKKEWHQATKPLKRKENLKKKEFHPT